MRRDQLALSIGLLVSGGLLCGLLTFPSGRGDFLADSGRQERYEAPGRTARIALRMEVETSPSVVTEREAVGTNRVAPAATLPGKAARQATPENREFEMDTSTPLSIYRTAVQGASNGEMQMQLEAVLRDDEASLARWSTALWALSRLDGPGSVETMARYLDSGAPLARRIQVLEHLGGMEDPRARHYLADLASVGPRDRLAVEAREALGRRVDWDPEAQPLLEALSASTLWKDLWPGKSDGQG